MTRWATGESDILTMLGRGTLEQVAASPQNANRLLDEARRHLRSAAALADDDPAGAYDMLYTAARKAMSAALAAQGLRATSAGGHLAVHDALTSQLGRSGHVVRPFGRLRRTRNDADYPRWTPRRSAPTMSSTTCQRRTPSSTPWPNCSHTFTPGDRVEGRQTTVNVSPASERA